MAKVKKQELSIEEKLVQALVPEDEQPYEVPSNWLWIYCTSLFDIVYGKGLPIKELKDEGYPVFGANGHIGYYDTYMYDKEQVLMSCRGAYSGTINITVPFSFVTNNSLILNCRCTQMHYKFIAHLFNSSDKSRLISGSAQPQVTVQAFEGFPLVIPPLTEQKRINDRIESLFEKLDNAKELAQNALDSFEARKAAILNKAFTGELTAKWREKNGLGMDSWAEGILLKYIKEKPRNGYSPSPVNYATNVKSLSLSATTSGKFRSEFFKYIAENIAEDSHLWLKTDDILIQRANSIEKVGTCAIYTGRDGEFIYPDLMMKISANALAIPQYLAYYLNTNTVREYYRSNATGTAGNMPKINQAIVANTPVVVPSIIEQQEIVRILDYLFENEQKAKELCDVIEKIDLMKKAIQARAFRGELGTNDPGEENAIEVLKECLK